MKQENRIQLAVAAFCFVNLMYIVPSVAVSGMVAAFHDQPQSKVLLLLTLPNLTGIIGVLAEPFLERWLSRKHICLMALSFFLVPGAISFVVHNQLDVLVACSVFMGIAYGVQSTVFPLVVSSYFNEPKRSQVMGIATGAMQFGRMATTLVAGVLAGFEWYMVYLCFAVVLVPMVLVYFCLPGEKKGQQSEEGHQRDAVCMPGVIRLALVGFCFASFYFVVNTHTSLYIEENSLGGTAVTGVVTAVGSIAATVVAAAFGWLQRYTGRYTMAASLLVTGVGYLISTVWVSIPGAIAAMVGASAGIGLFCPCLMVGFARYSSGRYLSIVTSAVLTVVNVGYFVSPYLVEWVASPLGNSAQMIFATAGGLALAVAAVSAIANWKAPLQSIDTQVRTATEVEV